MVKIKTSRKPKKSSKSTSKRYRLIKNSGLIPYDPVKEILETDLIANAIYDCLKNNDPEGVIEMISIYVDTLEKAKKQKDKITKATLSKSFKKTNPVITKLAKLVSANVNPEAVRTR